METIKAGVIGLGRLGSKHAADILYRIPGVELRAVCAASEATLETAEMWGVSRLYTDYRELLACDGLDAVIIVSPSTLHREHVIAAIDAGLHVFSEKPLALTIEDCLAVEQAAARMKNRVFMLGFMRRFDPSYRRVKQKLDSGEAGKPIVFKGNGVDPMSGIQEYLGFARTSGGPFLDMAIHDIDLAGWYMGLPVKSVYACGNSFVVPEVQEFGDNDSAFAILRYENDAVAMLHVGRSAPNGYQVDGELVCTKATYRINAIPRLDRVEEFLQAGVVVQCEQRFFERFEEAFLLEKQHFFRCIREHIPSSVTAAEGTAATRVALAATESMRTGNVVQL